MPTPMPNKLSVAMNRFTPGDKSRTKFTVYVHMDAPFLLLYMCFILHGGGIRFNLFLLNEPESKIIPYI
ncbi:hypothetical protein M5X11_27245 [Paenibacillus alginolyticus]|uniref:hypothetical protein n=1 Tax=Paenibacillus alginolyticus TaxID=59839 RepID=UPI000FDCBEC6|nr:hypothetical protein [Paenibacillus alginolyticus]MCY9668574.1 hypothetical protein [Paenibacillus alginolyticus]